MKTTLLVVAMIISLISCSTPQPDSPVLPPDTPQQPDQPSEPPQTIAKNMIITINNTSFNTTFVDNAAAEAFAKMLPLTVTMGDLNSNEKYYNLSSGLPTSVVYPSTIHSGDIMLFGSTTLVLFYKTFSTSYGYTKVASIDNPETLATVLGRSRVVVKFDLK